MIAVSVVMHLLSFLDPSSLSSKSAPSADPLRSSGSDTIETSMTETHKNKFGEQILPNRLSTAAGRKGVLIPLGLLTVLAANISALMVPFLTIHFMGTQEYKLIESVKLMWDAGIYLVVFLIVAIP